jgi:copper homeostasis protein
MDVEIVIQATDDLTVQAATQAAYRGGAARIELCADMTQDGLTPDAASIRAARLGFEDRRGLMIMIRPRAGDFCFSPAEVDGMARQVENAATCGADGVVLGVLATPGNRIAAGAMQKLVAVAKASGLQTTCHRAFDATPDPDQALETLIELGVDRVLTTGVPWGRRGTALDGAVRLAETIRRARGRVEIVLAGSIGPATVGPLLASLPLAEGRLSVHAYSGAHIDGLTTTESVRALVDLVNRLTNP